MAQAAAHPRITEDERLLRAPQRVGKERRKGVEVLTTVHRFDIEVVDGRIEVARAGGGPRGAARDGEVFADLAALEAIALETACIAAKYAEAEDVLLRR